MKKALKSSVLILVVSFVLITGTTGTASSQAGGSKYDTDDDGLIEVSNLEQLDAMRQDLDGDGTPDTDSGTTAYAAAYPTEGAESVCDNCNGYELARSLDFQDSASYASGQVETTWTTGDGWLPIAPIPLSPFTATLEGNEHTISSLFIDRPDHISAGLIGHANSPSVIRNVGIAEMGYYRTQRRRACWGEQGRGP